MNFSSPSMGSQGASSSHHAEVNMRGALSHVYIQYPPFRCTIEGAIGVLYDDGNKLLLIPSLNKVFSWSVNHYPYTSSPRVISVKEAPALAIRYSLDCKILAIQRTINQIEFINTETGAVYEQQCKNVKDQILGFFWTDCPSCDIVVVTASGLEMYNIHPEMNILKLVEIKKINVSWFIYTHESRLVLLASGMQCKTLSGYQFSAGGVIRLPKFEATLRKAEANTKPVLAPEDVRIVTMYGIIYCLQVDRISMQLNLFRFYRDAVVTQGVLPIYSANVATSVVDNVLLVHQIESKVVLLYDILSDNRTPISAPLPLLIRQHPSPTGCAASSSADGLECSETLTPSEANTYSDGWVFVNPDIILDHAHGLVWKIYLDLQAIVASSSDIPHLLAFLQRRKQEPGKAKRLSLDLLRSAIIERRPISLISNAMDVISMSYSQAVKQRSSIAYKQPVTKPEHLPSAAQHQSNGSALQHVGCHLNSLQISNQKKERQHYDERVVEELSSNDAYSSPDTTDQELQDNLSVATDTSQKMDDITGNSASDVQSEALLVAKELRDSAAIQQEHPSCSERGHIEACVAQLFDSHGVTAAISPKEIHEHVFASIEKDTLADSRILAASILEYMRSAVAERLKADPETLVLLVHLFVKDKRTAELQQLISRKVIEPSREMALQLLQVGNHEPSIYILGSHMLKQVAAHTEYVSLLLQGGRLLEALRYVRQNKVETISPSTFLEAAVAAEDTYKLASVLRFCLEFVPNFQQTSDFRLYSSVLKQQLTNLSVTETNYES